MGRGSEIYWDFVTGNYIKDLTTAVRSFFITEEGGGFSET